MTFLAQYRFSESKDIVSNLPGDILLVFVKDEQIGNYSGYFHFEWYSLPLTDIVRPEDCPKPAWSFVRCFGIRHRTVDYNMKSIEAGRKMLRTITRSTDFDYDHLVAKVFCLSGMKIGGLPCWEDNNDPNIELLSTHRFLCAMTDIVPPNGVEYPWHNKKQPAEWSVFDPTQSLYLWDGFSLFFFLDENGQVIPYFQPS